MCQVGAAAAAGAEGETARSGTGPGGQEEQLRRTQERQPRAEAGRDRDAQGLLWSKIISQ